MSVKAPETSKQVVAVIDIGTSAIRLVIAELGPKTEIRYLENLQRPVRFGKDVFTTGRLGTSAMREGISILKNYKTLIDSYAVNKVQAIATSAVREAVNSENFIDQVYVRTGIDVEVIEGPEENRLELTAVEHAVGDEMDLSKLVALIVEIGSGSTEVILLNQGRVEITQTLALGSIRLPERAEAGKTDPPVLQRVLRRYIHEVAMQINKEFLLEQVNTFIALGGDMRLAARQLSEKVEKPFAVLDRKNFLNFVTAVSKKFPEDLVNEYGLIYSQAEGLYPSLLAYSYFLKETQAENILVPMLSIRDGLLLEMAQLYSGYRRTDVSKQILSSARHLAQKYQSEKSHVLCVNSLALKLFDALIEDHGMGTRERLLLEVAATLHDVGAYVAQPGHHKHAAYLIEASDIFGLRKEDKTLVAQMVRYHRGSAPKPTHVPYMQLSREDRAMVSKTAAILRVADALDESRQQKIRQFTLERARDTYILWVPEEAGDISMERNALKDKGSMFADVFGVPLFLKQKRAAAGEV